ncbi:MAG: autotransporter domain-containing protein [Planctomycetia bacterium]|nr:autotransporter domain-containing protein [Planctomycetia bacterium]
MEYIGNAMKKCVKLTRLTRSPLLTRVSFGGCCPSVTELSLSLIVVLFIAVVASRPVPLFADGIEPDSEGTVSLTGTDNDFFAESLTLSGNNFPTLTFQGGNSDPFENRGKMGVGTDGETPAPIGQITADVIGPFSNANSGIINFFSGFSTSSLENSGAINTLEGTLTTGALTNNQNASITLSQGSITADSLSNAGTLSGGTEIKAGTITNSGTIQNADSLTTTSTTEGLVNNGIITGTEVINATIFVNNAGASVSQSEKITSSNLTNYGELKDIAEISGTLNNNGSVQLTGDQAKTMVLGGFNINKESELFVRLFAAGQGDATDPGTDNDLYDAGAVQVNGGTIVLTGDNVTAEFSLGDQYTVLTSLQEIALTEEMSIDSSAITLAPRLAFRASNDGFNYYVTLLRDSDYGEQGNTPNQRQFGTYIDQIGTNAVLGSDLDNVLTVLDGLSPGEEISPEAWYALAQMDGAVYGSMATMEVQNMTIVNNTLANYLRPTDVFCCSNACADPCNQGCPVTCQGLKMWGTYYGVDGYAKADGNAFGGDYSVSGVLAGGDRYITPNFRLGGFFAFGDTEYQVNGLNEQADADSYKAGLYFVRNAGNGYLFGNFNYGWDNFRMMRNIAFLDRTNTAKTSGSEWALRLEKGFNFPMGQTVFQPFGAFQYLSLNTDAFAEEGEGATALNVDEADYNSYRSEFGGRLLWGFEGRCRTGNLFFQASWMHEFGDTYGTVSSSFNNQNNVNYTGDYKYTVNGVDLGSDWCNLGIGGDLTQNNFTIFGGYDFMVSGTQNLHTGNVGLAYQF